MADKVIGEHEVHVYKRAGQSSFKVIRPGGQAVSNGGLHQVMPVDDNEDDDAVFVYAPELKGWLRKSDLLLPKPISKRSAATVPESVRKGVQSRNL